MTTETVLRNIGQNKGKPRLWIEGKALVDSGLDHGNRWNLVPNKSGFDIVRSIDGKRKIAGKVGRPIIDITGSTLSKCSFSHGDIAILEYVKSTGVISVRRQITNH